MGKKPGPPGYNEAEKTKIIDHVLVELACGRSVNRILAEDDEMPASSQFWKWHFESEDVQEKVARARAAGVEAKLDECVQIADEADGKESAAAAKVRVDARFKYAQMIAPRKYGPKLDLTSGGEKLGLATEVEAARKRAAE